MITTTIEDPFDATVWDAALEQMCNSPLPPEAYKDPEQWAVEELLASVEANADGAVEPAWANVPDDVLELE